jgi:hypothetical protein
LKNAGKIEIGQKFTAFVVGPDLWIGITSAILSKFGPIPELLFLIYTS